MAVVPLDGSHTPSPPYLDAAPPQGGTGVGCASAGPAVRGRDGIPVGMSLPSIPVTIAGVGPGQKSPVLAGFSTKGSNASPAVDAASFRSFSEVRNEAMRLRTGNRGLAFDVSKSVALCGLGRLPVPGENPQESRAHLVCDEGCRADVVGLTRCASPWSCPVCAPKLAASRARVLTPQIQARMKAGWTSWLITLTVRHGRDDTLPDLLAGLAKGWRSLIGGKNGTTLRALGQPEFIRGTDLTHSDRHGWHPHVHVVMLLPPGHGDGSATAHAFAARWRRVVGNLGFEALPAAQDVQRCADSAAAAAYATTPAAVYEAVGIGSKVARNPLSGHTAFDLLRGAVPAEGAPDPAMTARWCEYMTATKGRKQVSVSRGLTLDPDLVLMECAEDEGNVPVVDVVAELGEQVVAELDRKRLTAPLLEAIELAGEDEPLRRLFARDILSGLRAKDWTLRDPVAVVVEPLPLSPSVPFAERVRLDMIARGGHRRPPRHVPDPSLPPVYPPAPSPAVPQGWASPVRDGRLSRPLTPEDRAVLCRIGATAG